MDSFVNRQRKNQQQTPSHEKNVLSIEELISENEALKNKNKKLADILAIQKLEVDKVNNAQARYRHILNSLGAFLVLDNEFRIEEINESASLISGSIKAGNNFLKYFKLKEEKEFIKYFSLALQGNALPKRFIASRIHKGLSINYLIQLEVLNPGFQVAVIIEKSVDQSDYDLTKLSWLATKTQNGVIITDAHGNIEWVNQGFCQITGYKYAEILGEKPYYLTNEIEDEDFDKRIIQQLSVGKKFFGETISYKKSGENYWLHLDISPILNDEQIVTNYVIIETDITDKKETEQKLLLSAKRSINILESITDAMFIINNEWKFTYLNKQAEILLNHKKENLLGKIIWDEFTFASSGIISQKIREAMEKNIDIHFEEYIEPANQWFEFHGYVSIEGLSIYLRSIQSRKISEEKLKVKNEELVKINNELDSFVYRAAHDLRAPLASVLGLINISKIEQEESKKIEYLDRMTDCINKLDNFINKIIHYSRNSRLTVSLEEINYEEIFNEIFNHLKFFEGAENIAHTIDINNKAPFFSDKARIKDALQNILVNAVQYQKTYINDPYIKITIETDYLKSKIVIEDNGNGIHDDHKDKVFQMFYRASEQSNGSGLGLYIVKEIVKKLGGTIHLNTQLKIGTTFTIEIPNGR